MIVQPMMDTKTPVQVLKELNKVLLALWRVSCFAVLPKKLVVTKTVFEYCKNNSFGGVSIVEYVKNNSIGNVELVADTE